MGKFLIIHVLPFPGLWQNSSNRFALTDVIVDRWWVRKYCKYLRGNICKYLPPIPNIWICLDICDGLTSLLRTTLSSPIKWIFDKAFNWPMRSLISYQILPPRSIDRLKKVINLSNVEILTIAKRLFLGFDFWPQTLQPVCFPGWFQYSLNSK